GFRITVIIGQTKDVYSDNIIDGINFDDLTIEQYLRLTQENQTPSMVKKVEEITISEYIEYEEGIKRQYSRNSRSYFPTYSGHCISSNNTALEFPHNASFNPIPPNTKFNYDSKDMKLDEEAGYTTDEESVMSEHEAIDPIHVVNTQSFKEELSSKEDLDEWLKGEIEKHMSKQDEKNEEDALIAIIKSIIEECRVVHKNKQMSASEGANLKKSFKTMKDTINNDTFTSNSQSLEELNPGSFLLPFTINNYNSYVMANIDAKNNVMHRSIYEYLKLENLGEATMLVEIDDMIQQETLGTMKNILVKINKFEFPCDFVVTEMPKDLGEIIILGRPFLKTIHAQIDVFREEISLGIGEDRIKFDVFGKSEHGMLKQWICFRDHVRHIVKGSCTGFADFLQVRYGNQRIDDITHEQRYYEWVAQNYKFDNNITPSTTTVPDKCPYKTNYPTPISLDDGTQGAILPIQREEHAKEIRNPYSQRFDEYKRVFDNEVENLSNEYTLRVGKKGYVLNDV
ncbi:reverse transcriptase domain-containing protein, partial [Tanacetum coccineum]